MQCPIRLNIDLNIECSNAMVLVQQEHNSALLELHILLCTHKPSHQRKCRGHSRQASTHARPQWISCKTQHTPTDRLKSFSVWHHCSISRVNTVSVWNRICQCNNYFQVAGQCHWQCPAAVRFSQLFSKNWMQSASQAKCLTRLYLLNAPHCKDIVFTSSWTLIHLHPHENVLAFHVAVCKLELCVEVCQAQPQLSHHILTQCGFHLWMASNLQQLLAQWLWLPQWLLIEQIIALHGHNKYGVMSLNTEVEIFRCKWMLELSKSHIVLRSQYSCALPNRIWIK